MANPPGFVLVVNGMWDIVELFPGLPSSRTVRQSRGNSRRSGETASAVEQPCVGPGRYGRVCSTPCGRPGQLIVLITWLPPR